VSEKKGKFAKGKKKRSLFKATKTTLENGEAKKVRLVEHLYML